MSSFNDPRFSELIEKLSHSYVPTPVTRRPASLELERSRAEFRRRVEELEHRIEMEAHIRREVWF